MAGVVGKRNDQARGIFWVGRCLRGLIDGKATYRYTQESPRQVRVKHCPKRSWFEDGWFSRNLLDE